MELLRDPIWQFAGALIGFVAILVSLIFFRRQQKRKNIAYEVISSTPLLSIKEEKVQDKLQILFDGKRVGDLSLVVLRIYNSGDVPILSSDFERPIRLKFGEQAEILDAEVTGVVPSDIRASIQWGSKNVSLEPLLLNSRDSITVKVLLTQFNGEISVDGRVVGVKQILGSTEARSPSILADLSFILTFAICSTTMISLWVASVSSSLIPTSPLSAAVYLLFGGVSLALAGWGVVDAYNNFRR